MLTVPEHLRLQIDATTVKDLNIPHVDDDEHTTGHLNLVHCLSYGESWLLEKHDDSNKDDNETTFKSKGTPPFWRLLATLAGQVDIEDGKEDPLDPYIEAWNNGKGVSRTKADVATRMEQDHLRDTYQQLFFNIIGGKVKRKERVKHKVCILKTLQQRGIVFADVCPLPIYVAGGTKEAVNKKTGETYWTPSYKLSTREYKNVVGAAWEHYAVPMIQELRPQRIVVLGKKVGDAIAPRMHLLGGELLDNFVGVFNHPSDTNRQGWRYAPFLKILRGYATEDSSVAATKKAQHKHLLLKNEAKSGQHEEEEDRGTTNASRYPRRKRQRVARW